MFGSESDPVCKLFCPRGSNLESWSSLMLFRKFGTVLAKMLEIAHCSTYLIYQVKNLEQECYLSGVSDSPQVVHLAVSEPQFASEVLHQFE